MTDEELIRWRFATAIKLDPEQDCLFCGAQSEGIEANIKHMSKFHRFFIPDFEYLIDPKGLLKYLGQKLSVGFLCLYCNEKGRSFHSLAAVRDHMRCMSHCKIELEDNEEEFERFYDYSSSYDRHLTMLGITDSTSSGRAAEGAAGEEAGSSDAGSDSDGAEDPKDQALAAIERRARSNVRVSEQGTKLIFADGQVAGHRAYQIYHRQRYARQDSRDSVLIGRVMDHYRKYGYVMSLQDPVQSKAAKKIQKIHDKWQMQLGVKANKLQHHFRRRDL